MCGIAGIFNFEHEALAQIERHVQIMNHLQIHRGPDGQSTWTHNKRHVALGHCRLSIIDLSPLGQQPMKDHQGNWIVFNGEIYNYLELRKELGEEYFVSQSDTEVILLAYRRWGKDCVRRFRGMFAFALWDESKQELFCSRDRFGVKPFYYTIQNGTFYFASEIKALLPFISQISTDLDAFKDYLTFQLCLDGKTLFKGVREIPPAHNLLVARNGLKLERYWEVYYTPDFYHTDKFFEEKLRGLIEDSVKFHLRSDVAVGAYVSGGLDSSALASIAAKLRPNETLLGFTGKFSQNGPSYDESGYAVELCQNAGLELHEMDITADDFINNIENVIYHLDFPVAGPGSFSQYMVSRLAARHRKVVFGGQGGDEIFGGYTRYLIAYFEQCIKGAINGTMSDGKFIVTYQSIIPNLVALKNYVPLLQEFWRDGLFDSMDQRYYRLVNRAPSLNKEIRWEALESYSSKETFKSIFNSQNVGRDSYFDLMTNFDFKTLLPALLHVEDRMSMAHGLESRVPLLDHPLVEFSSSIPSNIKFKDGEMKSIYKRSIGQYLPPRILNRTDKMGFPTPIQEWFNKDARDFVMDIFSSKQANQRELIDNHVVLEGLGSEAKYGRKVWGLLSLELWQRQFHDRSTSFKKLLSEFNSPL